MCIVPDDSDLTTTRQVVRLLLLLLFQQISASWEGRIKGRFFKTFSHLLRAMKEVIATDNSKEQ